MPRFTVELDFKGMYSTEVEAESATQAKRDAENELTNANDLGYLEVEKISSFQVFDEKMLPCDVDES